MTTAEIITTQQVVITETTAQVLEVQVPTAPAVVQVTTAGPQGITGQTGVVTASAPLAYDANARSLSITLAPVATSGVYGDLTGRPTLGTAAATDASAYATAAQGAKADTAIQPSDSRLSDSREWSAATVSQAEAEAGTSTSRLAFTPQRVFQAIAAWWSASSAAAKLAGIASGATANATDAQLRDRSTHTGTQSASTITGLGTAAALNVGTSAGNVVQLDGSARLPAVDGSQLTGIVTTTDLGYTPSTRVLTSSTGADVTLPLVSGTDPGLLSAADKLKLDGIAAGAEVNVNADWSASSGDAQILNKPTLGTAAAQNVGTAAGNVVQLDGTARLPAVDGSQLTGINATTNLSYTPSTRLLESSTGTDVTLPLFATNSTDAGLVPGNSSASTTQFLRGDGSWAVPAGGYDALVDASTAGTLYVGRATVGTAQSTAAWTIVKSTFSAAGVRLTKGTATGVAWTGRTSATYT